MMSYLCWKCKKIGGHQLRFRDKACGKLSGFRKIGARNSAWCTGFIVKNIEGESTEADDLSHIL